MPATSPLAELPPLGFELPDEPRWVEAHGLWAEPDSWIERWPGGAMLGNAAAQLAVVCGQVDGTRARALAAQHCELVVLSAPEAELELPGRRREPAILHALDDGEGVHSPGELVAALTPSDSLAHVPAALARELAWALQRRAVWAAWVEGLPVAFAYASWRSPRHFDVSVETIRGYRQLGLGRLVAQALVADELARGRAAVWGATADNTPSLRLAASLGFVEIDRLCVHAPAGGAPGATADEAPR